jgi:hypothetical protein
MLPAATGGSKLWARLHVGTEIKKTLDRAKIEGL